MRERRCGTGEEGYEGQGLTGLQYLDRTTGSGLAASCSFYVAFRVQSIDGWGGFRRSSCMVQLPVEDVGQEPEKRVATVHGPQMDAWCSLGRVMKSRCPRKIEL